MRLPIPQPESPKSAKKALLAAIAKVIGIALGAGAGTLMFRMLGTRDIGIGVAVTLGLISFGLLWYVEYEKDQL